MHIDELSYRHWLLHYSIASTLPALTETARSGGHYCNTVLPPERIYAFAKPDEGVDRK
jgi:hypothetical protein